MRFSNYAKIWRLKISAKETKIIVSISQRGVIKVKLKIDDIIVQSWFEYTYLGTVFTPDDSLRQLIYNYLSRLVVLFSAF